MRKYNIANPKWNIGNPDAYKNPAVESLVKGINIYYFCFLISSYPNNFIIKCQMIPSSSI